MKLVITYQDGSEQEWPNVGYTAGKAMLDMVETNKMSPMEGTAVLSLIDVDGILNDYVVAVDAVRVPLALDVLLPRE